MVSPVKKVHILGVGHGLSAEVASVDGVVDIAVAFELYFSDTAEDADMAPATICFWVMGFRII